MKVAAAMERKRSALPCVGFSHSVLRNLWLTGQTSWHLEGQVEYVLRRNLKTGDAVVVDVLGVIDGQSDPILAVYIYLANNPMNMENGPVEEMGFRPISDKYAVHALTQSLSEAVRQSLPKYYVPGLYILMDRVPRTKSKKTDRRKLHMLGQAYYMEHRDELEDITVWFDWSKI